MCMREISGSWHPYNYLISFSVNFCERAHLVVCGYHQRAGIDYLEHFAPVLNNVLRRILLLKMKKNLKVKVIDLGRAVLNGDLEVCEWLVLCPASLYNLRRGRLLQNYVQTWEEGH